MKRLMGSMICATALSAVAFASDISEARFLLLDTRGSSFWQTAVGSSVTIPVEYPESATSATLAVDGTGYHREYEVTAGDFRLQLPTMASVTDEDVYTLTLTFDDGTVRSARVGHIRSAAEGGFAKGIQCLCNCSAGKWAKALSPKAVLPLPQGADSISVNEVATSTGLDGAAGWYVLSPVEVGSEYRLAFSAEEEELAATLFGVGGGLMLLFR